MENISSATAVGVQELNKDLPSFCSDSSQSSAFLKLTEHAVEVRAVPDYVCLHNIQLSAASGYIMVTSIFLLLLPYREVRWEGVPNV